MLTAVLWRKCHVELERRPIILLWLFSTHYTTSQGVTNSIATQACDSKTLRKSTRSQSHYRWNLSRKSKSYIRCLAPMLIMCFNLECLLCGSKSQSYIVRISQSLPLLCIACWESCIVNRLTSIACHSSLLAVTLLAPISSLRYSQRLSLWHPRKTSKRCNLPSFNLYSLR